jgi:antirestriction protein
MGQIDILSMDELTTRFAELRDERETLSEAVDDAQEAYNAAAEDETTDEQREELGDELAGARKALQDFDRDDGDELEKLQELIDATRGYGGDHQFEGDWFPAQLIAESDFEDYARELAEDIGAIPDDASWPCTCIDWEKAARELQTDYSSVTYDGTDYLYR